MDSHGISRAPCYLGYNLKDLSFRLQDFHFLGFSIPTNSSNLILSLWLVNCPTTLLNLKLLSLKV